MDNNILLKYKETYGNEPYQSLQELNQKLKCLLNTIQTGTFISEKPEQMGVSDTRVEKIEQKSY